MSIKKEDLIEFGMKEMPDNPVYPFQKHLTEDEEKRISICITTIRNAPEFCLMLPNGDTIYLNPESIEELEAFERCIQSWEPNY